MAVRGLVQALLGLRIEPMVQAHTATRVASLLLGEHRQGGDIGQLTEALGPPGAVGRIIRGGSVFRGKVIAEGVVERGGEVRVRLVQGGEVLENTAVALRVGGEHIDIDVQAVAAAGEQRQCDIDDLRGLDIHALMALELANAFQLDGFGVRAQGDGLEDRAQRFGQGLLGAAVGEAGAQLLVPVHQAGHRAAQSLRIETVAVEFDVQVGGDAAEGLILAAAHPVGMLHGGQGEFLARRGGFDDRGGRGGGLDTTGVHQGGPGVDGRLQGQGRAAYLVALLTPLGGQMHEQHRMHPQAHEIGVVTDRFGRDLQRRRHEHANLSLVEHRTPHPANGRPRSRHQR